MNLPIIWYLIYSVPCILAYGLGVHTSRQYIPSMNIHEHSKNVIGQLLLAE